MAKIWHAKGTVMNLGLGTEIQSKNRSAIFIFSLFMLTIMTI